MAQTRIVRFDCRAFSLTAVKKAAYRYIHKFSTQILLENSEIICTLTYAQPLTPAESAKLIAEFQNEALDQDLREQIKAETEPIRKLILAHAFSMTGLASHEQVPRT